MNHLLVLIVLLTSPMIFAEKIVLVSVPRVEMLLGIGTMYDTVQIQVESNGCTTKESFYVQKYMNPDDEMIHLRFIRVRPDWCKAYLPEGTRDDSLKVHSRAPRLVQSVFARRHTR